LVGWKAETLLNLCGSGTAVKQAKPIRDERLYSSDCFQTLVFRGNRTILSAIKTTPKIDPAFSDRQSGRL
jgi:hypothetical protein